MCKVLGCPCRIDFSRAEATFIASSGNATSISFLGEMIGWFMINVNQLSEAGRSGCN
jgi:hypothetical protein